MCDPPRLGTVNTRILRIPDCVCDSSNSFARLFDAFGQVLSDSAIVEVGDFLFVVAQDADRFKIVTCVDSITHPMDFSKMPKEFNLPLGTASEGSSSFEFLHSDQLQAVAVYVLQGNFGILFWYDSKFRLPTVIRDVTPAGFVVSIENNFGISFKSWFEHPDQYSKLGKTAF